ncbi:MAG TPA: CRISPR-associated ring nuclease Csm6 [Acidobacteriota bacterium]|nr:CRISPR-associated ring nuclease Csm6 [Acidobacteriota bacterium]
MRSSRYGMFRQGYCDVLFSVLGTSPAILTETVWALAHEEPPVIPDHVFVLTTIPGRDCLKEQLFDKNGWAQLKITLQRKRFPIKGRLKFGCAGDHVRLFPQPDGSGDLVDIVTPEESRHAADFILRCLREFTEDPGSRVIASIAGGRKTMGALLTSCMILLGRKQDRICHVLVSPPYDSPDLDPPFLFPSGNRVHVFPESRNRHPASKARIQLTDIPFVRVRGWYEKEYRQVPPSYMSLVRSVQGLSPDECDYPVVFIDMNTGRLSVGGTEVCLSHTEFAFFTILARRVQENRTFQTWADLEKDIRQLQSSAVMETSRGWQCEFGEKKIDLKEDPRKLASSIRRKMASIVADRNILDGLIPSLKTGNRWLYPPSKIRIMPE